MRKPRKSDKVINKYCNPYKTMDFSIILETYKSEFFELMKQEYSREGLDSKSKTPPPSDTFARMLLNAVDKIKGINHQEAMIMVFRSTKVYFETRKDLDK